MKTLINRHVYNLRKNTLLLLIAGMTAQWTFAFDYPEEGDFARGSQAWSDNCTRCHNMRSPSDLRDDQWLTTTFHMRVRAGLTGQETRDILTFLQSSNARIEKVESDTSKPISISSAAPLSGKHVYEKNCVACHGINGKGSLPGTPDFTRKDGRLTKSETELLSNIINGFQSSGSLMPMPPRGGNTRLTDADLLAALKYIKTFHAQ
jgi:mono/diheme cytochrome c family protein